MAKGMSMEEFRRSLESEARNENETLKTDIEKLKANIEELKAEVEKYKNWCVQLCNRCLVHSGGYLCGNCEIDCCKYALTYKDYEKIAAYARSFNKKDLDRHYNEVTQFISRIQIEKWRKMNASENE